MDIYAKIIGILCLIIGICNALCGNLGVAIFDVVIGILNLYLAKIS